MTIDEQLRDQLRHTGEHLVVGPGSLARVRSRGVRRRNLRRAGMAVAAVTLGVSGGVVGVNALRDDTTQLFVAGPDDGTVDGAVAEETAPVGAPTVTWERVAASSVIGYRQAFDASGGQFVALSTAPGPWDWNRPEPVPEALYRSGNGIDWTEIAVPDGLGLSDVGFVNGSLVAVGTAATTSGLDDDPGRVVVAYPDDGWRVVDLPIDLGALRGEYSQVVGARGVVADLGGKPMVVVLVTTFPDIEALLGDRMPNQEGVYAYLDGTNVVVQREQQMVDNAADASASESGAAPSDTAPPVVDEMIATYSLAELGLSDLEQASLVGRPYVFVDAGDGFVETAKLPVAGQVGGLELVSTPSGVVLGVTEGQTPVVSLYHSTDGVDWTPTGGLGGSTWLSSIRAGGAGLIAVAETEAGSTLYTSADGFDWVQVPLDGVLGDGSGEQRYIGEIVAGDAGFAATVDVWQDQISAGGIDVPSGDFTIRVLDDNGSAVVLDASGGEVGRIDNIWFESDQGQGTFTLPDGAVFEYSADDLSAAMSNFYNEVGAGYSGTSWVITSRDGRSWSATQSLDVFGQSAVGVGVLAVTDAGVIVRGSEAPLDPESDRTDLAPMVALGRLG